MLIGAAGTVAVGAITPGPNNFAVMTAAARAGFSGAVPAIAGVVLGSLALLVLADIGTGAMLAARPRLMAALSITGCAYLTYIGVRMFAGSFGAGDARRDTHAYPTGTFGLFAFQFVNPKAWVLTLTVVSTARIDAASAAAILPLAAIFAVIPAICLALWSALGAVMSRLLSRQSRANWFDRAMGSLLIASAVMLGGEALASS